MIHDRAHRDSGNLNLGIEQGRYFDPEGNGPVQHFPMIRQRDARPVDGDGVGIVGEVLWRIPDSESVEPRRRCRRNIRVRVRKAKLLKPSAGQLRKIRRYTTIEHTVPRIVLLEWKIIGMAALGVIVAEAASVEHWRPLWIGHSRWT